MKYSVVIAAYNASSTITAALQSCVTQKLPVLEIIVVDDASTDNTVELIRQQPMDIKIIRHSQNKGVSAARNTGWNAASGDYVAFLDSDDIWHPEKLFWINRYLQSHGQDEIVGHQFTTDSKILSNPFDAPKTKLIPFSKLLLRNRFQGSCIVVRRNIENRFDEKMRYCEDYDLVLRCAYHKPIALLCSPLTLLSRAQQSEGGLSGNRWAMRQGELYLYRKIGYLNPLLLPVVPLLYLFSLLKHLFQKGR
jgi:teichuronic acid biosynthesis glycosyltransferase TuaG